MGKKGKRVRRMGKRGLEEIRSRLSGSRFRCINEKLYKCKSDISFTMFNSDPKLYSAVGKIVNMSIVPRRISKSSANLALQPRR